MEEVLNVNYWKEVRNEFHKILENLSGIVLLTHNSIEFPEIVDIIEQIKPDKQLTILYLSLIRTYDYMDLVLSSRQLNNKRFVFIDCPSSYAFTSDDDTNECMYRKMPNNLQSMIDLIRQGVDKANPDIVIIDPITQFINFTRPTGTDLNNLYNFLKSLRDSINVFQDTFILLYDTKMNIMQQLPKLSTDLILKVEVIKGTPPWKD
ncbi:hypothetical protein B6U98_05225 [Thermoplasmatales archaeon ex4572_165]|nr:MAG: hypothetical protein B6U98_05225 [Thermoplasmatales archaeon ex4572_165]